ncbi:hypothetical protein [Streptomyces sp. NPDC013740]|uniref:hypothetical protein n=1 Tax=Streptomyces sp. NPDC013740 TaxID=3364867 RepID=UPI0036F6FD13
MDDDHEPVFRRSRYGWRYEYNPRNPVGMFLIIASLVVVGVMMALMANRAGPFAPPAEPTWSPPAEDWPQSAWPSPATTAAPTPTSTPTPSPTLTPTPSPTTTP